MRSSSFWIPFDPVRVVSIEITAEQYIMEAKRLNVKIRADKKRFSDLLGLMTP